MVVTLAVLPACALKVHVYWQQWDRHRTMSPRLYRISTIQDFGERGPMQVIEKGSLIKMFERWKWYIWMGFGLTFWKLNRSWTGDGTMVTYAQVRYSDLGDYVWVVCVYIVNKSGKRLCNSSGWFYKLVKPSSVIVESQEDCGFSKSILKSPSTRISAWGLTVWMLSNICTKLSNH